MNGIRWITVIFMVLKMCVCVCMCVCVRMHACVHVCDLYIFCIYSFYDNEIHHAVII